LRAAREVLELMWAADKLSRTAGVNETSEVWVAAKRTSVKGRALNRGSHSGHFRSYICGRLSVMYLVVFCFYTRRLFYERNIRI